ncbi:biopolymer transporter ExbD [Paracoccus sp. 11-3]|uniref:Biopolymer transporter ExbD n=1 Tax=Paracoccus amoyensis TaxID=2760093 RepID=A0A926G589_9RHOB|nr:biopolymer transporter ExbD [Paracoccus amoyensis]MBC9245983.1 biopolymer transporter ExbD [Paracoccus amoyensis]
MIRRRRKSESEPTIALINVVFLMLIFFLVAGTIAPSLDKDLQLVRTADIEGTAPADALVLHPDGRMTNRGRDIGSAAAFVGSLPEEARADIRIIPDRDVPASTLVALGRELREAGAERVLIVTERGMP